MTPDELGDAWDNGKLHWRCKVDLNGQPFGRADAGEEMTFDFGDLVAHVAKTRNLGAGTIIGSGTVSNKGADGGPGAPVSEGGAAIPASPRSAWSRRSSTASRRRRSSSRATPSRIGMRDAAGHSIFGAIEQEIVAA